MQNKFDQQSPVDSIEVGRPRDIAPEEVRASYPYMGMTRGELTSQEERFVSLLASGMSVPVAGRSIGLKSTQAANAMYAQDNIQKALRYFLDQANEEIKFGIADAHKMYIEAYGCSSNAMEMKSCVDGLVKLHGIAKDKDGVNITHNHNNLNITEKQLQDLSDDELLRIAGKRKDLLPAPRKPDLPDPVENVVEAEYEPVSNE